MSVSFLHALKATFASRASRTAFIHHDRQISYAELDALARRGAAALQKAGLRKGDRVALCVADKPSFLLAHLAALVAGGISLPLNPRFTTEELRFFLKDSGARIAVAGPDQRDLLERLRPDLPDLDAILGWEHQTSEVSKISEVFRPPDNAPDDPCLIMYSSGTTGWPKGIVHTHANVASSLLALQQCWRITPDDVVLNVLPLFHVHGLSFATHLPLLAGASVILEDHFQPQRTMELLRHCTVFMAVPTIYYRLLEEPEFRRAARSWSNVRLFTCGSAPIRPEVLPELETILGRPVINRYGMTEAFVITSLPLDGPWPQGSVGLPLEGIEVRVTTDTGGDAAAGEVGSVLLRGANLFREYWRQPDTTRAAFATGWFETGDLGFRDAAGFLTLAGRKNDLIITSGFNVYPQVVERVLNSCPGVRESAVVGIPDPRRGELVAAAVVRDDFTLDEAQLLSWCGERLVDYQRPKKLVFVESLPRNALGKVLRRELQELLG